MWWDVGDEFGAPDRYFLGIEVDCRINKFGVDGIDEIVPQLAAGVAFWAASPAATTSAGTKLARRLV